MKWSVLLFIIVFSFVVIGDIKSANATTTLRLKNGTTIIDVQDNSADDLDDATDIILFNGAVGSYTTNITTGIRSGTLTLPELDLVSVDVISSSSGGMLEIWLSDIGLGPFPSPGEFNMSTGGT